MRPVHMAELSDGRLRDLTVSTSFFLQELRARQYTHIILMDHLDWQDETQTREVAAALWEHTAPGARIIFRSAAYEPPYAAHLRDAGFTLRCVSRADVLACQDLVNQYASFWLVTKPR